nr:hypothetical protein [Mycobacterium colombiense]
MPSLSMEVFGPAGSGGAPGDGAGEAAGAGAADAPGAGACVSSGSALATTVDAAQPAIIRLAATNLAAVGTPPIDIEGTGVKNLIHIPVKSALRQLPPRRAAALGPRS